MTDVEARAILDRVIPAMGITLDTSAVDLVQAVARFETRYGAGWSTSCAAAAGSHNWGAIHGSCKGANVVQCTDTHEDGTPYDTCFRTYATDDDGATDLVNVLWQMPHVRRVLRGGGGDVSAMATAMRVDRYYEAREDVYVRALVRHWTELRASLGRPVGQGRALAIGVSVGALILGTALVVKVGR